MERGERLRETEGGGGREGGERVRDEREEKD